MRATLHIITLTLLCTAAIAQTGAIKGRVIDSRTFKPLAFATVYFNQTTIGTVTDMQGDFIIDHLNPGSYDLVVSYVGYQLFQQKVTVNDIQVGMSIKLIPSTTNLQEVTVRAKKDDVWAIRYEKFKKQFFGESPYAINCSIQNPWVLEFTEDTQANLTATASLPIEIENTGLGYKISCQLKDFVAGPGTYRINGTYRFQEMETHDTTLAKLWLQRRVDSYQGSARHLIKALINKTAESEGFQLYIDKSNIPDIVRSANFLSNLNNSIVAFSPSTIVNPGKLPGQFTLTLPTRLEVHYAGRSVTPKVYKNVYHPVSWLEVPTHSLDVTSEGAILNPARLIVAGAMGEARVAELLPYNFYPEVKYNNIVARRSERRYSSLAVLVEKPCLLTDKPYYYPTESVLFKVFMNYASPLMQDSLSHVVWAEILDASGNILQRKSFPLIGGNTNGDFNLPMNTKPGDYTLRVYTRWMLNFDPKLIENRPFKVLSEKQLAKSTPTASQSQRLNILTEKDEFHAREKITIALEASNFYDRPVSSTLAISVTDLDQAAVPANEQTILNKFAIKNELLPDTSLKTPTHLLQYGVDFKGRFVAGKKAKAAKGVLTVYQNNTNDVFTLLTDDTGNFYQQLQLMDSVELYVKAGTVKGKLGKIVVDPVSIAVPAFIAPEPIDLTVYIPDDASRYHVIDRFSTARMLEVVTIESKKIEKTSADRKTIFSDKSISGDDIRATNATDLLTAIQGRVPGLRVLYSRDGDGLIKKTLVLSGGITSYEAAQECLIEVDGVVINSSDVTVAEQLASMSIQDVDRVDVIRFGGASAYGARAANGVISIKTRMGASDTSKKSFDKSKLQLIRLQGYSPVAGFESPEYTETSASSDDHLDFRSTIYWNPSVVTSGESPAIVSFYAADIPTRYRIVVEGINSEGQPVRGEKIITITAKK